MPSFALYEYCDGLDHRKFTGDVIIPEGTRCVGYRAFESREDITSVYLPDSVKTICDRAFSTCSNLRSIRLPEGLNGIGENAFVSCEKLEGIDLPESVTVIGRGAFAHCKCLEDDHGLVIMKNRLISCNSRSLAEITVPDGVTVIEDYAFAWCDNLTGITLPEGVISIGKYAFEFCGGLKSINIPSTVEEIGYGAFFACDGLTSVTIPNSVTSIGDYAFHGCEKLAVENGTVTLGNVMYDYYKRDGDAIAPEEVTVLDKGAVERIKKELDRKYFKIENLSLAAPGIPFSFMKENGLGIVAAKGFIRHYDMFKDKKTILEYASYINSQKKKLMSFILANDRCEVIKILAGAKMINEKNIVKDWLVPAMQVKAGKCIEALESLRDAFCVGKKNKTPVSVEIHELWDDIHFSIDGKKLIKYEDEPGIEEYHVPEGTQIICKHAFDRTQLKTIYLPESLRKVEDFAFRVKDGYSLCVHFPDRMKKIPKYCFWSDFKEKYFTPIRSAEMLNSQPKSLYSYVNPIYYGGGLEDVPDAIRKYAVNGFIYSCEHEPDALTEWKDGYFKFIKSHLKDYIEQAASNAFFARLLMKENLLTESSTGILLDLVTKNGDTSLAIEILAYNDRMFKRKKIDDEFSIPDMNVC